jgi:hypothetical protein
MRRVFQRFCGMSKTMPCGRSWRSGRRVGSGRARGSHFAGSDADGLLCLEQWATLFGAADLKAAAKAWADYVDGPVEEERANVGRTRRMLRTGSRWNRPAGWVALTRSVELVGAVAESPSGFDLVLWLS